MKIRNRQEKKQFARTLRHARVRAKISGTAERPRLSVFRSAKHVRVQLIDDAVGRTLTAVLDTEIDRKALAKGKIAVAEAVGKLLAERGIAAGIKTVVFDRGGYNYHGRVKAVADGARAGGLQF